MKRGYTGNIYNLNKKHKPNNFMSIMIKKINAVNGNYTNHIKNDNLFEDIKSDDIYDDTKNDDIYDDTKDDVYDDAKNDDIEDDIIDVDTKNDDSEDDIDYDTKNDDVDDAIDDDFDEDYDDIYDDDDDIDDIKYGDIENAKSLLGYWKYTEYKIDNTSIYGDICDPKINDVICYRDNVFIEHFKYNWIDYLTQFGIIQNVFYLLILKDRVRYQFSDYHNFLC